MVKIDGKYKYLSPKGNLVSRQRMEQLRHPDRLNARKKKYNQTENAKAKARVSTKKWQDAFKAEHGLSYQQYYYKLRKELYDNKE